MITRRHALKTLALTTGAISFGSAALRAQGPAAPKPETEGVFKLPPLGYDYDALEPFIDAQTMKLHHDKHHAGYVSKLNLALAKTPALEGKSLEDLLGNLNSVPEEVRADIRNQGGGHANHTFFWQLLNKNENGVPSGELAKAIEKAFGSFPKFQQQYGEAALKVFGSGWTWLVVREGKLLVESTPNQDSPISTGARPLLGIDVWEHAYYLHYENRRADYIKAFQNVINWDFVAGRFQASA